MSQGFIVGSGGGQSKGAVKKGTIVVTYPNGATCTVSNGTKTYTALDTSGAAAFVVEPGEWTVTAVQGFNSCNNSVAVTAGGWVEVFLEFNLVLYDAGNEFTEITGGWTSDGGLLQKNENNIYFDPQSMGKTMRHTNLISFASPDDGSPRFSTVTYTFSNITIQSPYGGAYCSIRTSDNKEVIKKTLSASTLPVDVSVDVSTLTGEYWVCVTCTGNYNTNLVWSKGMVTMTKVVLE